MYGNSNGKEYLLPSYFDIDNAIKKEGSYRYLVAKPLYGREGTGLIFGLNYSSEVSFRAAIRNGTILGPSIFQ
jgi:glutathionylspermidine synthase